MNEQRLAFSVHDGDLKSGSSPCTDDVYTYAKATLDSLSAPAMFTPGDNDWTDCDRGPHSSAERLAFERRVLFSTPYSFGRTRIRQEVQAPRTSRTAAGGWAAWSTRRSTSSGPATTRAT